MSLKDEIKELENNIAELKNFSKEKIKDGSIWKIIQATGYFIFSYF